MRVLILGGTGLLGQKLLELSCSLGYPTMSTYNSDTSIAYLEKFSSENVKFTISNIEKLKSIIDIFQPSHIFNCLSISNINTRSSHELFKIYTEIPRQLISLTEKYDIKIINISSDAVYKSAEILHTEKALTSHQSLYGKFKRLGEVAHQNVINVRCSMYGIDEIHERGLLNWYMIENRPTIFTGYYFTGLSTITLSRYLIEIAEKFSKYPNILHLAGQLIQKSDLLQKFDKVANLNKKFNLENKHSQNFGLNGSLFMKISGLPSLDHEHQLNELVNASTKVQKFIER